MGILILKIKHLLNYFSFEFDHYPLELTAHCLLIIVISLLLWSTSVINLLPHSPKLFQAASTKRDIPSHEAVGKK